MKLNFASYFEVDEEILKESGYVNISLLCDIPLFIDPFLIFASDKEEYKNLHSEINKYLNFLKQESKTKEFDSALYNRFFKFSEVYNNWFGYCKFGNRGSGLGPVFGKQLYYSLKLVDVEKSIGITKSFHIEKLCLLDGNIGSDNISDFVTNLIKKYFLDITQTFAKEFINSKYCRKITVEKVEFNYTLKKWMPQTYYLPVYGDEYILLTPMDILTKDTAWINSEDLINDLPLIIEKVPNVQLKSEIVDYLSSLYSKDMTKEEEIEIKIDTIKKYPLLLDYYIAKKENEEDEALQRSIEKVLLVEENWNNIYFELNKILLSTDFYKKSETAYDEALERVMYLKNCIENNDVYKLFYDGENQVITKESDLQLLFRLVCFGTISDVNREVNNGRGPVDYKFSKGQMQQSIVEFKLAKNPKLEQNLENQVEIYQKANRNCEAIKVIFYFKETERERVKRILKKLEIDNSPNIILIDCVNNKPSASNVK